MLGNDVVDLRDADAQPETFRLRFDARVFAPAELRAIERDAQSRGGSHVRRWAHWAAKEAAYKLARQIDSEFVFSPSKLVACFDAAVEGSGHRTLRRGRLDLPKEVAPGFREVELRCSVTADRVHVVALPAGADWEAVVTAVEPLGRASDSSAAVRDLAVRRIAQSQGIEPDRITIGRRGRIPTVDIDGAPSTVGISLSHHGGWLACAMTLRCESAELPERADGVDSLDTRSFGETHSAARIWC